MNGHQRARTHRIAVSRRRFDDPQEAMSHGRPIIVCDSADPTEAFLVCAADRADTATMAFIIRHTSGLIEVALDTRRCGDLGLVAMTGCPVGVAGRRVSVDAADGSGTGISATDRAHTARVLADSRSTFDSLARPGHVGIIAVDRDTPLTSRSTADLAVELTHSAGGVALAQIVSITDPTQMAAGREIWTFSAWHSLPVVTRSDIVAALLSKKKLGATHHSGTVMSS